MTLSEGEGGVPEDRTGGGRDTVTFFLPRTSALARFGREKRKSAVGALNFQCAMELSIGRGPRVHRESCMLIHGCACDREMNFGHHCGALRACPSRWCMILHHRSSAEQHVDIAGTICFALIIRELVLEGAMWHENVILRISAGSNT